MITASSHISHGRTGNILFRYASLIGLSTKYGHELRLPKWKYEDCFEHPFPPDCDARCIQLREVHYHAHEWDILSDTSGLFDIHGYLQSELYWIHCKDEVLKRLQFKSTFKNKVKKRFDFTKKTIGIHIRRGDYVNNFAYYQLPITYYYNALQEFKDWRKCSVIIFSDDIEYCKFHFQNIPNIQYANGNEIEDLCLMSQCDRLILSNSSYSWWAAYLSGSKEVIRPDCLFTPEYGRTHNDKDFWVKDWKALSPVQKLDLRDVTFTIPVYWDHQDRQHNLNLSVCVLQHYCDTNVMICENNGSMFAYMAQWCEYYQTDYKFFHRTRMLNDMAREAKTPIVFNWDADILISPLQILATVEKLRAGVDLCFPYDGRFARISRIDWFKKLEAALDPGILSGIEFSGMEPDAAVSVGGAIGFRRDEYLAIGGENENFISFGAEDVERVVRAKKLGLKVERVKGCLYHINHWTGMNSTTRNPYFFANKAEYEKVDAMTKQELIDYISTWEWKTTNQIKYETGN